MGGPGPRSAGRPARVLLAAVIVLLGAAGGLLAARLAGNGGAAPIAAPPATTTRPATATRPAAATVTTAAVPPPPPPPAAAPPQVPASDTPVVPDRLVVPYRVVVDTADPGLAGAPAEIAAVLEDPRGWQQADIDFVADPDAPHTIVLAEGDRAQQLCLPYDVGGRFSCQNGPTVVLNAIRWREAVPHWPGDLASYRTMLVNHEVGHLIGMHHIRCGGAGRIAPVMEQQSGSLRGCTANPWPTPVELRLAATHQFRIAPPP